MDNKVKKHHNGFFRRFLSILLVVSTVITGLNLENIISYQIKSNVNTGKEIIYEIPVKTGEFDLISKYYDEEGNKCQIVYNYLNGQIKYMTNGENESYNIYNDKNQLTAAIEHVDSSIVANTYSYVGENVETITHNGFQYEFQYDEDGNMTIAKVAGRTLITNEYEDGMLTSETYGNGSANEYVYDENGNVTEHKINGVSVYQWKYDEIGNLIEYRDLARNEVFTYTYDEESNLRDISSDSGFKISYTEDEETSTYSVTYECGGVKKNQVTVTTEHEEKDEAGNTKSTITTNLISGGKLVSIAIGEESAQRTVYINGKALLSAEYTYTNDGISKIEYQDGKILEYTYDNAGNITEVKENGSLKLSYEYDSLGQLVRENNAYADRTYTFEYDNAGNILSSKEYAYSTGELGTCLSSDTYEYADMSWKDLLTGYNGQSITYDEIGNPLNYRDGMTFTWNGRQLEVVKYGDYEVLYTYNSEGIRTSKTVNGITTSYQLEGTKIISETTGDTTIWYIYDENDMIIGFEYLDEAYYFEKNAQGDVLRIFDETGKVVSEYVYDAWGNVVKTIGDEDIAKVNPFRYRGYYQDNETGFYYALSRYYDSQISRWINADSINALIIRQNEELGLNIFTYCDNNSINFFDPTGEILISTCILIGVAIGATAGAVVGGIYGYNVAEKKGVPSKDRWKYVVGYGIGGAVVFGVIGGFMGYGIGFLCGATSTSGVALKAISTATANISTKSWSHIITKKHAWDLVLKNVTQSGVKSLISQALKKGTTTLIDKMAKKGVTSLIYETVYSYMGQKIIVHYAVVDGVLKISDAWVKTR